MDHFPLFSGHLKILTEEVEVPNRHHYDNQGYQDFPLRVGFDELEVSEGLFLGQVSALRHESADYACLIQSWFYWGLIHACTQEPIDPDELSVEDITGRRVLDTTRLESRLVKWALRLQSMNKNEAKEHIRNAKDALGRTIFLTKILSERRMRPWKVRGDGANARYWETDGDKVFPLDLEVAICALGFTLSHTTNAISYELKLDSEIGKNVQEPSQWYTPSMLLNLLRIYKFCESDMIHFDDDVYGFITSCMAIGLSDLSRPGDHSACTNNRCKADNIKPEEYVRKHIHPTCECNSVLYERTWHDMLRIVERDGIPVLRVRTAPTGDQKEADLQVEVTDASKGIDFVAFSHVWADGRGNQTGNEMFCCTWQWLQRCAQLCTQARTTETSPADQSVPFWIDTYCVPRGQGQRLLDLRNKSIIKMSEIYRSAKYVVVLDSALENLSTRSPLEFALRLKFCTWSRRVWTLHEGAVGNDVLVLTADGLVSIRTLIYQMATAKYPIRDETGWHILQSIELEYVHAVLPTCIMFNQFDRSQASMFEFSWRELAKRTTSIENDRYTVLAIMNRCTPETLLALQRHETDWTDPKTAARDKLKRFLLASKIIPQSVIFTSDMRFEEPGMRWAPNSIGAEIPHSLGGDDINQITEQGAIVSFKGWRQVTALHTEAESTFIRIKVASSNDQPSQTFDIAVWPTDADRKSISSLCRLFSAETPLAIILEKGPQEGGRYTEFERALLVEDRGLISVEDSGSSKEQMIVLVNYIGLLRVMSTSGDRNPDKTIQACWAADGAKQLWCVG